MADAITPGGTTQPTTPADQSAKATLLQTLASLGLPTSLGEKLWQEHLRGVPDAQILLDMRQSDEYKARYPAMETLTKEGRAITEAQYVNFEQQVASIWHQAGLSPDMMREGDYVTKWLEGDVSSAEVQHRVQDLYVKVANADPAIRQWYQSQFGTQGDAALAATFADPTTATPILDKQVAAAQFGGTGSLFGYNIDAATGLQAANAGVSQAQAQAGFQKIQDEAPLFNETISENQDLTAEQQGVAATFGFGSDASKLLAQRAAEREAAFKGSTSAGGAASQSGFGLGVARSNNG